MALQIGIQQEYNSMMVTTVREKSSLLRHLQESICCPTGSHHKEVSSSLNTPPLELTRPSVKGEEKTSNTTPEEAVSSSALHLEHVLSSVESIFSDTS